MLSGVTPEVPCSGPGVGANDPDRPFLTQDIIRHSDPKVLFAFRAFGTEVPRSALTGGNAYW